MGDMKKASPKLFVILLATAVLLFFLSQFKVLRPAEDAAGKIFSPLQAAAYAAGQWTGSLASPWFLKKNLDRENAALKAEIGKLTLANANLQALERENAALRENLSFFQRHDYGFALADIVGKSTGFPGQEMLILNRGESDGIKVGCPVVAAPAADGPENMGGGFLIGKIAEADRYSSRVLLLTDSQSNVAATVLGGGAGGLVSGQGGSTLRMDLMPTDEKLEVGSLVVTSGLESGIPKDLLIGEIEKANFKAGDFFQTAAIKPLIDFGRLRIVAVLIPKVTN